MIATAEETTIRENRLENFERLGFAPYDAMRLAVATHVHYYDAKKLIDAGCDPATAARILV